jgi:hypothetical protein
MAYRKDENGSQIFNLIRNIIPAHQSSAQYFKKAYTPLAEGKAKIRSLFNSTLQDSWKEPYLSLQIINIKDKQAAAEKKAEEAMTFYESQKATHQNQVDFFKRLLDPENMLDFTGLA